MAKNEESVKNSAFGFGVLNPYEKYFTGKSYLHGLAEGNGAKAHVAQVTFAPGTINHWHSHNLQKAKTREKELMIVEKQTAGRDHLGKLAPKFAELNDDVLFGQVWSREDKPAGLLLRLAQGLVNLPDD